MNITFIALSIIVILLIYVLYNYSVAVKTLIRTAALNTQNTSIVIYNLPSYSYTMNCWFYLQDNIAVNSAGYKKYFIFSRQGLFDLYIQSNGDTIGVFLTTYSTANAGTSYLLVNNIPIQQWIYITMSVNNNFVDFMINGKLVSSITTTLNTVPPLCAKFVAIGGNFSGSSNSGSAIFYTPFNAQVSKLMYVDGITTPKDAYAAYLSESSTSITDILTTYTVDLAFLKNGTIQATQTIL